MMRFAIIRTRYVFIWLFFFSGLGGETYTSLYLYFFIRIFKSCIPHEIVNFFGKIEHKA